jgi:hypothetical protein
VLPCVEDWIHLTPWNVNSRSWYCLATQISRLLMVPEGSYTAFTRGRHGFLSQAIFSLHPATVFFFNILIFFSRLFLGVSSGSLPQHFRPICAHFCVSCMLSAPPISHSFAYVILIRCCEKDKEVGLRRHYAVCAWCLCPCLTAPDFIFWTTSLMFAEFCVEIMPLEASPAPDFPHSVVTTWRTLELVRWEVW